MTRFIEQFPEHRPKQDQDQPSTTTPASALPDSRDPSEPQGTTPRSVQTDQQDLQAPKLPAPSLEQPAQSRRGRPRAEISREEREEVVRLQEFYGARKIAKRIGVSRYLVTRVLEQQGLLQPRTTSLPGTSKLDPFREAIESRVKKGLTTKRIHRELAALGYDGGRTILADYVQQLRLRVTGEPKTQVKRRFETAAGEEMQIDWSPYVLPIAGRMVQVRALGCLLGFSRKLYLYFYRNERQSTLLEGLANAFQYFGGTTQRIVLDNMSTAVLGHLSKSR